MRGSIRKPRYFFCERAFPGKKNYNVLPTTKFLSFWQILKDTRVTEYPYHYSCLFRLSAMKYVTQRTFVINTDTTPIYLPTKSSGFLSIIVQSRYFWVQFMTGFVISSPRCCPNHHDRVWVPVAQYSTELNCVEMAFYTINWALLKNIQGERKVLTPLTFQLALMEFLQELSNSIWRNCKGDSCGHLQCIYANNITILAREQTSFSRQVVQTERHIGRSEASHLQSEYRVQRG